MKLYRFSFGLAAFLSFATVAIAQQNAPLQIVPLKPGSMPSLKAAGNPSESDIAAIVARANSALNNMNTLAADFVQSNSLGHHATGRLYLLKPGRLRFEYAAPSAQEIIADGTSLAIRNKKLNTQDIYFIRQTPLKFLLKPSINLSQDVKIIGVSHDVDHTIVRIEDRSTFGGASKIDLFFKSSDFSLSQWIITDGQGGETKVKLSNIDQTRRLDRSLFVINFDRPENQ